MSRPRHTQTYGGTSGRRSFGPRDPRPHPSTLGDDHVLSARVHQLGLDDQSYRPAAADYPRAPPRFDPSQPHSHSSSHRPRPAGPSRNPFPAYPPYPGPPTPQGNRNKPLPSPSHSPDRPRPRANPRHPGQLPPQPRIDVDSRGTTPQPRPKTVPPVVPRLQVDAAPVATSNLVSTPSPTPSPRRKKPPPVVSEISSSSSSSSTAEFTDNEDSSSIEFTTTPSSSPSLPNVSRPRRTPSPNKKKQLQTPPSNTKKLSSRSPSPNKEPTSRRSSPAKTGSTLSTPTPTRRPASEPRRTTPARRAGSSPSPSSSPSKGKSSMTAKVQCHGLTSTGKQCTRLTSSPSPLSNQRRGLAGVHDQEDDEDNEEETNEPVYCHQHTKTSLVQTGCFVNSNVLELEIVRESGKGRRTEKRSREVWINYNDWILPDLPLQTQSLLRHYLEKPVSDKDREGYIYIHELIDKNSPPTSSSSPSDRTYLKLGRTIHPVLRLTQWRSSCPSLDPIVRDILPRRPLELSNAAAGGGGGGGGNVKTNFAERGTKNHFRWERLCLVEIAGRVQALYGGGDEDQEAESSKCRDCGKKHLECFRVGRDAFASSDGAGDGGGWVVEIVERWERWCRDVLG